MYESSYPGKKNILNYILLVFNLSFFAPNKSRSIFEVAWRLMNSSCPTWFPSWTIRPGRPLGGKTGRAAAGRFLPGEGRVLHGSRAVATACGTGAVNFCEFWELEKMDTCWYLFFVWTIWLELMFVVAPAALSLWRIPLQLLQFTSNGSHESDEGDEGDEGDEDDEGQSYHEGHEDVKAYVQGRPCHGVGWGFRIEEERDLNGLGDFGWDWHQGGEESRQVYASRPLHDQDTPQEGNQGWQEDDVRPGSEGQGPACQDCGEGFPRGRPEAANLKRFWGQSLPLVVFVPLGFGDLRHENMRTLSVSKLPISMPARWASRVNFWFCIMAQKEQLDSQTSRHSANLGITTRYHSSFPRAFHWFSLQVKTQNMSHHVTTIWVIADSIAQSLATWKTASFTRSIFEVRVSAVKHCFSAQHP